MHRCPYCAGTYITLKRASFHVVKCTRGPGKDAARAFFYTETFKYSKEDFINDYVNSGIGLKGIHLKRGIPYRILKFLARYYGVLRGTEERVKLLVAATKNTLFKKYGVNNPIQIPSVRDKIALSLTKEKRSEAMKRAWANKNFHDSNLIKMKEAVFKKYGVENVFLLKEFQEKAVQGMLNKFGVNNISKSKYKKDMMVKRGRYTPEDKKSDYRKYKEAVKKETYKWIKNIFTVWIELGGLCYYTFDKLLKEDGSFFTDRSLRPSIDHKISVLFGYLNDIPPEVTGHFNNLCVCSSHINSIKRQLTENQFRKQYPNFCFSERLFT